MKHILLYPTLSLKLVAAAVISLSSMVAHAQQAGDEPALPSATTTIRGKQLPAPAPKFGGVIK